MGKDAICVMDREDLIYMLDKLYRNRFEGREVDSNVACQILGISMSTLNRWINYQLIQTNGGKMNERVVRKFDLAYLFTLDISEIKKKYRLLNK